MTTEQTPRQRQCNGHTNVACCDSVKQIVETLNFYQQLENDFDPFTLNNPIVTHFNKHPTIITDYHHIILQHLSSGNIYDNNINLNIILETLLRRISSCDVTTCIKYARNLRGRYRQNQTDDYTNTFKLAAKDATVIFYKEFLDTMHCYFIHPFDSGRRKKSKQKISAYLEDDSEEKPFGDKQMKQLFEDTKCGKNVLPQQFNKFTTEITDPSFQTGNNESDCPLFDRLIEHMKAEKIPESAIKAFYNKLMIEEYDTDALIADIVNTNYKARINVTDFVQNTDHSTTVVDYIRNRDFSSNTILYSFGLRYYYWEPCKTHFLYISKKYDNFKQEMLSQNKSIPKDEWDRILVKANNMLVQSVPVKSLKSCDRSYAYAIKADLPIQQEHIMSLCFYTDTTDESYEFSKSFRRIKTDKNLEDTKKRNEEFREWSRLLREMVECYGTRMNDKKSGIKVFYHGVSFMYFISFIASFCGPTSTAVSFEIATRFADETGIILELEQAPMGGNLRYFNCSYLSRYNEEECLFIGGEYPLKFKSIRNKSALENYEEMMLPLSLFDKITNGERVETHSISKRKFRDCINLIHDLIKQEIEENDNNYPEYINTCFKSLVKTKKVLRFNILYMKECYPLFTELFMDEEYAKYFMNDLDNNLLAFDFISNVFKDCREIYSLKTDPPKQTFEKQNWLYLDALIPVLNRINMNKRCKLNRIIICGKNDLNNYQMYNKYKDWILTETEWCLDILKRDGQLIIERK